MAHMTPREIAARLTPAQRRALLWLPGDGTMRRRQRKGQPIPHGSVLDALCRKVLAARVDADMARRASTALEQQLAAKAGK